MNFMVIRHRWMQYIWETALHR